MWLVEHKILKPHGVTPQNKDEKPVHVIIFGSEINPSERICIQLHCFLLYESKLKLHKVFSSKILWALVV